ncbi:MAG: FecR domain-containing protein [Bacteroides sp.]|nr:FecR domain-containing protein [Bacteroides sp.]
MNNELLQKYISGDVTEAEKQRIVQWIEESPENMREYMAQRKLHDIALWRTEPATEVRHEKKKFTLRSVGMELIKMAAVFALALVGGYYMMEMRPDKPEPLQSLYVPAGQRAELMLADGTKVWLNSRSSLTFPGSFDGDTRQVKLDGEGYFDVAKHAERPFIVETNKYNVRVLGTEFNVKAYAVDSV